MATVPWVYNDSQAGGLARIKPQNGAMPELAASGNVLISETGSLATVGTGGPGMVQHRTPAGVTGFAAFPVIRGIPRRPVDWRWRIVAISEAALVEVENKIGRYLIDGGTYVLSDGIRSSAHALLSTEGTARAGKIEKTSDGRWLCDWRLRFLIVVPSVSATSF